MLRRSLVIVAFVLGLCRTAPHAAEAAAAGDLLIVVHPSVSVLELDRARLESIFTVATRKWPDGKPVLAFNFAPEDELRRTFDRAVLRMTPDQVGRFWIDQGVREGLRAPRHVPDPAILRRLVARLPGSIGYLPEGLVDQTVRVVGRLREGKIIPGNRQ